MTYWIFLVMALTTVASPGPGVILTLNNTMRSDGLSTFFGICGLAVGALIVSVFSATSVGVLITTSETAFTIMKYSGALYLFCLGIKMLRAHSTEQTSGPQSNRHDYFLQALYLQFSNPKAVFFFLATFPHLNTHASNVVASFSIGVFTYCALIIIVHSIYAVFARRIRGHISSEKGSRVISFLSGAMFITFSLVMILSDPPQ
ncbi:LysE family translocator [Terasakiella sp. A23]|uniref:LysE family translocator n=1 Tax=Terasakiella sp. FCG-A23 TaxID=3080561 RepID=UPI0029543A0F|nr:LysE family translocator [Terasakiella sp. A23]MDV7338264.1 LysE family translocator [Terasakiella sp. A23]